MDCNTHFTVNFRQKTFNFSLYLHQGLLKNRGVTGLAPEPTFLWYYLYFLYFIFSTSKKFELQEVDNYNVRFLEFYFSEIFDGFSSCYYGYCSFLDTFKRKSFFFIAAVASATSYLTYYF